MTAKEILNEYWDSLTDENKNKLTNEMGIKWLTLSKEGKILGHAHIPRIGVKDGVFDWETHKSKTLTQTFKNDVDEYYNESMSLTEEYPLIILKDYTFNTVTGELTITDVKAFKEGTDYIALNGYVDIDIDDVDCFTRFNEGRQYWVTCLPETDGVALILAKLNHYLKESKDEDTAEIFKQYINKLSKHIEK